MQTKSVDEWKGNSCRRSLVLTDDLAIFFWNMCGVSSKIKSFGEDINMFELGRLKDINLIKITIPISQRTLKSCDFSTCFALSFSRIDFKSYVRNRGCISFDILWVQESVFPVYVFYAVQLPHIDLF